MKVMTWFALAFGMFLAPSARALECYDCVLCSSTSYATPTRTCEGLQVLAGMPVPLMCATINTHEGPDTGVVRTCLPNVLDGCIDGNWQGHRATICYCTTDRCNSEVFTPAANTPRLPGPSTTTVSTTTRDLANPLECYDCFFCSSVTSSTPTRTCKGTEIVGDMEMPLKCGTVIIYDGPKTEVARKCAPNVIEGCMDLTVEGSKAKACFCSKDLCNSDDMTDEGFKSTSPALPMESKETPSEQDSATCENRCLATDGPCSCDFECEKRGDCCDDFFDICQK